MTVGLNSPRVSGMVTFTVNGPLSAKSTTPMGEIMTTDLLAGGAVRTTFPPLEATVSRDGCLGMVTTTPSVAANRTFTTAPSGSPAISTVNASPVSITGQNTAPLMSTVLEGSSSSATADMTTLRSDDDGVCALHTRRFESDARVVLYIFSTGLRVTGAGKLFTRRISLSTTNRWSAVASIRARLVSCSLWMRVVVSPLALRIPATARATLAFSASRKRSNTAANTSLASAADDSTMAVLSAWVSSLPTTLHVSAEMLNPSGLSAGLHPMKSSRYLMVIMLDAIALLVGMKRFTNSGMGAVGSGISSLASSSEMV